MSSKSSLKRDQMVLNDPKYRGKTASRREVFEGVNGIQESGSELEESDEDEEEGNEEEDEEFGESEIESEVEMEEDSAEGESVNEVESSSEEQDNSSEGSYSEAEDEGEEEEPDQDDRRQKVRQLLAQENKSLPPQIHSLIFRSVAQQLASSAVEDAQKGRDIKSQQRLYDTLLDALMRFQKALLALNSLPQGSSVEKFTDEDTEGMIAAAKQEALNMFSLTLDLRIVFSPRI